MLCDVTSFHVSPVLLCTTKNYSRTTPYYKALVQYCSVLQSTTPELLCTTKYYSSTAPYYKEVLLQNYSVLQSTTPVLQSTTLYYKVLRQYWHDALRWNIFGSQSTTTHDCSVDAVRNDIRQLYIILFKVFGQEAKFGKLGGFSTPVPTAHEVHVNGARAPCNYPR